MASRAMCGRQPKPELVDADAKKLAGGTPITGFGRLLLRHWKESEAVWINCNEGRVG
jgi:hypothetical protein